MTAHALAGLLALNALYLLGGLAIWLVRGLETWLEVARLAGLASSREPRRGLVLTLLAHRGRAFRAVDGRAGSGARDRGVLDRRSTPRSRAADASGIHVRRMHFVAAVGIAAAESLEAFFRVARLSGLYWWDAWSFWVPKAKAIYGLGKLDVEFFTTLPGSSYPPLVPVLDAAAFHAMGSADVVTLHVQYWLFGVGFVWALAGILAERVPAWISGRSSCSSSSPRASDGGFLITEADLFLDYLSCSLPSRRSSGSSTASAGGSSSPAS